MTPITPELLQQLCAWMDGELPDEQARFLQRRLDSDVALRAQWERWQLASACLRGMPVRRMPPSVSLAIAAAVSTGSPGASRDRRWSWLAGAAAAMLVVVLLPRLLADGGVDSLAGAESMVSTPVGPVLDTLPRASGPVSPLPSVRDFPLADRGTATPWPRSPLAPDDRSMEDYLVRHNTLMAEDGLGGFMPYVDVVAHEDPSTPAAKADPSR